MYHISNPCKLMEKKYKNKSPIIQWNDGNISCTNYIVFFDDKKATLIYFFSLEYHSGVRER